MSQTPSQNEVTQSDEIEVDEFSIKMNQLKKKQKPALAIGAAFLASIIISFLWILISQKYKVAWMSLALGFGTAYATQYAGKIVDSWYGFISSFLTLIGIIFATLFTAITIFSNGKKIPKSEVIAQLDISTAISFIMALMQPIDMLISLGAIFAAFWFSHKHIQRPMP